MQRQIIQNPKQQGWNGCRVPCQGATEDVEIHSDGGANSREDGPSNVSLVKLNPLLHFGLCNGTRSSPKVKFFLPQRVVHELRVAAREFFEDDGIEVHLEKRTVYLTRIFKWFSGDFWQEKEVLKWIINYLNPNKAGLLTHLLGDGGPVNVSHPKFDWSINF